MQKIYTEAETAELKTGLEKRIAAMSASELEDFMDDTEERRAFGNRNNAPRRRVREVARGAVPTRLAPVLGTTSGGSSSRLGEAWEVSGADVSPHCSISSPGGVDHSIERPIAGRSIVRLHLPLS